MENKKSVQQNMLFNTVGSLIYYVCQWFMTVVVVRLAGYEQAGILSLTMSVTAAPAIVGMFNIRSYQVSDVKGQYSIDTYFRSRVYTNVLSYLVCIILVVTGGYSPEKVWVILVFMLFKVAEGFADVYYGVEQKYERMDYAGISLTIRGIGTILLFVLALRITGNLLIGIIAVAVFSFLVIWLYDYQIVKKWKKEEGRSTSQKEIWSLLIVCVPLAVVAFLNNLSINIPKIFLERFFGAEVMGYYSSVASPTVVIQLAATTVFAPLVPILTKQYLDKDRKAFLHTIKSFVLLVAGLSVVCVIASKLLARWGLMLLFGADIEPYVYLFVPVILISILIAVNACLFSICTLLRIIKLQYVIGTVGLVSSLIFAYFVVKPVGMMGVVYATAGSMVIQIGVQLAVIIEKMRNM